MSEKIATTIKCPSCGHDCTYTRIIERFAVWTGEWDDDDQPAQETQTAEGFTVECFNCGFGDGEPAHW